MDDSLRLALAERLLALADDELLLAHRNAEWTGHAPILEEDIAIANIAQDELGHAQLWYEILAELTDDDPDDLVFFRQPAEYRNARLLELPRGDWAFTLVRQFLFDAYERHHLEGLEQSQFKPVAAAAAKIRREEHYHLRHSQAWIRRLGLGTGESQRRARAALDELWPYALQLFLPLPTDGLLVAAGYAPDLAALRAPWESTVGPFLTAADLPPPAVRVSAVTSRSEHSSHLESLLADMQSVARLDPGAEW